MLEHSCRINYENLGKTVFLWYLLRYRLSRRLPTVFAISKTPHFFHKSGVYLGSSTATNDDLAEDVITAAGSELVWALVDVMDKNEPAEWLVTNKLFPVQSACPDVSRYKSWMKV
jgi:hypothetical protein